MCQDDGTVRRQSHLLTIQKKKQKWGDCNFFVCLCSPHLPFTCQNFFEKNLGDIWPPPPNYPARHLYIYIYIIFIREHKLILTFFSSRDLRCQEKLFFIFSFSVDYFLHCFCLEKKSLSPHRRSGGESCQSSLSLSNPNGIRYYIQKKKRTQSL